LKQHTIKWWQKEITKWSKKKGFDWSKTEIDTSLLRLANEVTKCGEWLRDNNTDEFARDLADAFIRLVNICEVMEVDLEKVVTVVHEENKKRPYLHGHSKR